METSAGLALMALLITHPFSFPGTAKSRPWSDACQSDLGAALRPFAGKPAPTGTALVPNLAQYCGSGLAREGLQRSSKFQRTGITPEGGFIQRTG